MEQKENLGIYVHIPFCEKKCDYCNFVSFCLPEQNKVEYIDALTKEITIQGKEYKNYLIDTIFVGGGTPTSLPNGQIADILHILKSNFNVKNDCEITVECNPNSLTIEKLQEFKYAGVTRLSVGLQAYSNRLLKLVGRLHNKKQFNEAIKNAQKLGFENINVDLILGIPTQKMYHIKQELRHLVKLGISHISAYGLIVEGNTKLHNNLLQRKYKLPSEELQIKMYDYTKNYLQKHGINRYEVSNFAKAGFECKHNLKYWTDKEYLGLGLVSSSYVYGKRWKNTDILNVYINSLKNGTICTEDVENLSKQDMLEEYIMLSLRTVKGIDLKNFKQKFGFDLIEKRKEIIQNLISNGLLENNNDNLFCTDLGFQLLNQIILELI